MLATDQAQVSRPDLLSQLSNELLSIIVSFCRQEDLPSLARTCRRLHSHAFPALYRTITINGETRASRFTILGYKYDLRGMLKTTRSLHFSSRWYRASRNTRRGWSMNTIEEMTRLQHLFIEWDYMEEDEGAEHHIYLPSTLAETLRTCTISFKCFTNWPLDEAACLFEHPTLRKLEIHWAEAKGAEGSFLRRTGPGHHSTALEELSLIDCQFHAIDLFRLLSFPRALQYLDIWSDLNDDEVWLEIQESCEPYFAAIRDTCGETLKGLRLDLWSQGWWVVPAPGLHELPHLQYLEIKPDHIEAPKEWEGHFPLPQIDCPIDQLLPPNTEVLKIGPYASAYPVLLDILERKAELVPSLRKIILSVYYRDESLAVQLTAAVEKETDTRNYSTRTLQDQTRTNLEEKATFKPSTNKATFELFDACCKHNNIELVVLYEDPTRKEIFKEGAGPALWEIADQVI